MAQRSGEGSGVVFRHVVAIEILFIGVLQQSQAILKYLGWGVLVPLNPVKDSPLNLPAIRGLTSH
jgi:hypothetical protein